MQNSFLKARLQAGHVGKQNSFLRIPAVKLMTDEFAYTNERQLHIFNGHCDVMHYCESGLLNKQAKCRLK